MVAISVDSVEQSRRTSDRLGLEYRVLSDADATAIAAYGVLHPGGGVGGPDIARPATFVVGPDGVVVWRDLTENYRIRPRPDRIIEVIEGLR